MHRTPSLLRRARTEAGLTQAELARRAGTSQSVVARMEAPGANPRVESLEALLGAMDRALELTPASRLPTVDDVQIREQLASTPLQRLRRHDASQHHLQQLRTTARRVKR